MSSILASTRHQYNAFYMLMIIIYVFLIFITHLCSSSWTYSHWKYAIYMHGMLSLQCLSQGLLKH